MLDLPLNLYRLFHPFLVRGNTCICTFNEIKLLSQNSNSEMNYNFKCSLFRIATPVFSYLQIRLAKNYCSCLLKPITLLYPLCLRPV